ncbi:NUDIX domain-containing protein [Microvirga tunisiensis]|uniref:NUDIX domain-containing protein n=1 Tax=Microvirga tunisiensis TaxID=2108360 RepID=UPI00129C2A77
MLVTTRGRKRWIVPKGWPVPGLQPYESAAREAFEEAGLDPRHSDFDRLACRLL